jgi:type II secretory pathway pseudopilin PulG
MTGSLRRDDGFTMVELLLVCVISLVIFGATTAAWTNVYRSNRVVENQQENAEAARGALDRAARQLRNLANPTVNAIYTIDRATDYDFIFQTSDPSKTWVRYCLQTDALGDATLWESENSGAITTSPDMRASCPGVGWLRQTAVVTGVTNQVGGIDRNVFTYECSVNAPATCPATSAEYPRITNVGINLWVDADRADQASELNVATSVFLRNQNEGPTSAISDPPAPLGREKLLLNGSGSSDPEGRTLDYFWFEDVAPTAAQLASTACTATPPGVDWQGVTFSKKFDEGTAGQSRTFYLLVRDPGCLTHMSSITFGIPT